jgi:type II secretory pathway pseudopilin PulG
MFKKGAMFGLDARIALAIFGALSVISGAALYSAIQESKVVAVIADLNELDKASTAYLLDTGENIPFSQNTTHNVKGMLSIDSLVVNRNSSANVPYISYKDQNTLAAHDYILAYKGAQELYALAKENTTWSNGLTADGVCKKSSANCNTYFCIWDLSHDIMKAIETKIDTTATPGDDNDSGNVRYNKTAKFICLQGAVYSKEQSVVN